MEKDKKKPKPKGSLPAVYAIWNIHPAYVLPGTKITLTGYSLAALKTNFFLKELSIMLDAGLPAPNMTIDRILVTHCHSDHIGNIAEHIHSYKPPNKIKIFVPKGIEAHTKTFIESSYLLTSHTFPEEEGIKREDLYLYSFFDLLTVNPGDIIDFDNKNKKLRMEVFKCFHPVPCVGYGISEIRKKLKDEYLNLKGKEIGELRKKGVDIYYDYQDKFICYLGDTSKEIFTGEEWNKIIEYKNIVIECTFLDEDDYDQAEKTMHIHWKDLEPIVDKYKENNFILIHFSQRYDTEYLQEFFKGVNKSNVIPWIN
ncbi:MAG: hypothetical protein MJ252_04390 [archaeon]|nr:hypothetical protein [archaeon]